jgi:hypothetical protein
MNATVKIVTEATLCSTDPSASARCRRRSERIPVASASVDGIRSRSGRNRPGADSLAPLVSFLIIRCAIYRMISASRMITAIRNGLTRR